MILPPDDAPLPPDLPDEGPVTPAADRLRAKILDHALRSASWALQAAMDVLPQGGLQGDLARWAYTWGLLEGLSGRVGDPQLDPYILEPFRRGMAAGRFVRTGRPA